MKLFVFFYFISASPEAVRISAPNHARYWADKLLSGGPFADLSGGFITFEAKSFEEASNLVEKDPFILNNILSKIVLKEWLSK